MNGWGRGILNWLAPAPAAPPGGGDRDAREELDADEVRRGRSL